MSEFYKHSKMKDGHLNKCKECTKTDTKSNRNKNIKYYKEYDRSRGYRQGYSYTKEYRTRYPNKYNAHVALNNAIRAGKIVKHHECELCGSHENIVGHHPDYNRPLTVNWWCQACHMQWHKINGDGENP